jgi:hypothetical protein
VCGVVADMWDDALCTPWRIGTFSLLDASRLWCSGPEVDRIRMSASYGKGARGKATRLHSLLVRTRAGFICERCGASKETSQLQCAHIVSRHYAATRTLESNAFCLCASCHCFFGKWPVEFGIFVLDRLGEECYNALKARALEGRSETPDWEAEVDRLQRLLDEFDSRMSDSSSQLDC